MALKFSPAVRNARADAVETTMGTSCILKIRTGAPPTNPGDADTGTVLATINLASDWMSAASGGAKSMSGLPVSDNSADASGTAGHFRVYRSNGTTCDMQGTVSEAGGGGDMIVVNDNFEATQPFTISAFGWTEGNG